MSANATTSTRCPRRRSRLKEIEMKSKILIVLIALASTFAPVAYTADDDHTHDGVEQHGGPNAKTFPGHGIVNAVDPAGGKVNLSHDPIKTLKWPKMTMDFTVHPAILKDIKPGMEVDFELTKIGHTYQIIKITPISK
jgi:Cu/Ag efflux protein CusF